MKTIEQLLTWAVRQLQDPEIPEQQKTETALLDAQVLLAFALGESRTYLLAFSETEVADASAEQYETLVQQRKLGHPIAYLLGEKEFWSLPLFANSSTLIPRADTERLVEVVLETLPETAALTVADLGTGTGAIALALATERPCWSLVALEKNPDALSLAKKNIQRHQVKNVQPVLADWLQDFEPGTLSAIVSNPPYISSQDPHLHLGDVRYEPASALVAAENGLADFRKISEQACTVLKPGGWIFFEHGYQQADAVAGILRELGFEEISCFHDYAHQPRVTCARRGTHER